MTEETVANRARDCYRSLDALLGDKMFMVDGAEEVGTLDVVVYAHLACHIYPECPNKILQTILNFEFPRLVSFVERTRQLTDAYSLPITPVPTRPTLVETLLLHFTWPPTAPVIPNRSSSTAAESTAAAQQSSQRVFFIISSLSFLIFTLYHGLLQIEMVSNEETELSETDSENDSEKHHPPLSTTPQLE